MLQIIFESTLLQKTVSEELKTLYFFFFIVHFGRQVYGREGLLP